METVSRQRELGQESAQLRELNERLECYLQRVSVLERENSSLREHIQQLKPGPHDGGKQKELEEALEAVRLELAEGWRETDRAALRRDSLLEELRLVSESCCREARLRASVEGELAERRRWLEEEQRSREGLEGKVRRLQEELGQLEEAQRGERELLLQEIAKGPLRCPAAPLPALSPRDVQLCLGDVDLRWTEARDLYRDELARMERTVSEAGLRQEAVKEETRLNRQRVQGLRGELEVLREKKRQLEGRLRQQSRAREQDTQRLQATMAELELDKESLAAKMDQIVEDQRELMQMKLALSLEVATYRALLDTEAQRIHSSAGARGLPASLRDAVLAFPGGKGLSTEKLSAPVRVEAGNVWRAHSGAVTAASGWRDRSPLTDAAPTRSERPEDKEAGATWPGESPTAGDLVDGEAAMSVPRGGGAGSKAEECPADDRSSVTPSQEEPAEVAEAQPPSAAEVAEESEGEPDTAGSGMEGERPQLAPPFPTEPAAAEDPKHPSAGAGQLTEEPREPVEGNSDTDPPREASDSAAGQSEEPGEPVQAAVSREESPEAAAWKQSPSEPGEVQWPEEADAVAGEVGQDRQLEEEELTPAEAQHPPAGDTHWDEPERAGRWEGLETRRLSGEEEEAAAENLLSGGEGAPRTHEASKQDDRGTGDGAVEGGVGRESEAGYSVGQVPEERQPSGRSQEPEEEVTGTEEHPTDDRDSAIPFREELGSEEALTGAIVEAAPLAPPAAEEGASEGRGQDFPGESVQERPAEGSADEEGVAPEPWREETEAEAEPRPEAAEVPLELGETASKPHPGEERVASEGRAGPERESPREEDAVKKEAPAPVGEEHPADHWQGDRDSEPWEANPEESLSPEPRAEEEEEVAGTPGLDFSQEAEAFLGDEGEGKDWAGELEDGMGQGPEPEAIQEDAARVQEVGPEVKTAATEEGQDIGAEESPFGEEPGDMESEIAVDENHLEMGEGELESGWADQAEIPGEAVEPETESGSTHQEIEEEAAPKRRASASPQVKTANLAQLELIGDGAEIGEEEAGGADITPSGEGAPLALAEPPEPGEERSTSSSALPDGPEEEQQGREDHLSSPGAPSLGEEAPAEPFHEGEALRDSPEGAEDRTLPLPSPRDVLQETPGSAGQLRAEWPEDAAQAYALPSQETELLENSLPWEDHPDGHQPMEGFSGAERDPRDEGCDVISDADGEGSPVGSMTLETGVGMDGLEGEARVCVEAVDNPQATAIPDSPEDPTAQTQQADEENRATSADRGSPSDIQTPGNLLPDHGEIRGAADPGDQGGGGGDELEVADQEGPRREEEAEDRHVPSLMAAAERPGPETDGGCPMGEQERVTLQGEADESDSGQNEGRGPQEELEENSLNVGPLSSIGSNGPNPSDVNTGSGDEGGPVGGEGAAQHVHEAKPMGDMLEPAPFPGTLHDQEGFVEETSAGEGSLPNVPGESEEGGDGGSVDLHPVSSDRDLLLSPHPAGDEEPRPVTPLVPNDRQLNGLHDYPEVPGKGDGRAVEMIATAYHYWSSEDE
ncbi:nestin [Pristis pectinata]|uniref:nestin n=1 Tax=Pristis pectinata TaxID=685728 RepID=UPI00223E3B4E|nr:nestin [Pristis pectinata]